MKQQIVRLEEEQRDGSDASVEASRLKSELEAKVAECEQLKRSMMKEAAH